MTHRIKLRTEGYYTIIDDEDFDLVQQYRWYADIDEYTIYARADPDQGRIGMHALKKALVEAGWSIDIDSSADHEILVRMPSDRGSRNVPSDT